MFIARTTNVLVERVKLKHTLILTEELGQIAVLLEKEKESGINSPSERRSWHCGVWLLGVYEREAASRNTTD